MSWLGDFFTGVRDFIFPGYSRNEQIENAQRKQNTAVTSAQRNEEELFKLLQSYNEPLVQMGNEQLQALKEGIESGAFSGDEDMFRSYEAYVAPEYKQGGLFQYESRDKIVTPEKFEYMQKSPGNIDVLQATQYVTENQPQLAAERQVQDYGQSPGQFQYGQQAPSAFQYSGEGSPGQFQYGEQTPEYFSYDRQAPSAFQYQGEGSPGSFSYDKQGPEAFNYNGQAAPGEFSYDQQAPTFNAYQQGDWQNSQYAGRDYMTNYDQYQGQSAPNQRQIDANNYATENYQYGATPDIYTAEAAPGAQYYDPSSAQYQQTPFNLEEDPVFQRRQREAVRAIDASGAAKGAQLSGDTLKALQDRAGEIAAEEGQAAWERWRAEDETGYQRFQDEQNRIQNAMQYKSEDEYRRYLDQVGIKGAEADKAIQQFNVDRQFGADMNKESWLREQSSKEFGRQLNNDEFDQWLATDGQKYAQWADQRDWQTSQSNIAADQDWNKYSYEKGFGRDVYTSDRTFGQQSNLENFQTQQSAYSQNYQNALAGQQQNFNQYNQQYQNQMAAQQQAYNQYSQDYLNSLAAHQQNYSQYNQDYQNALAATSLNYGQYNQNYQNALAAQAQNYSQYNQDYQNQMAAQAQNYGQYNQNYQNALAAQQQNYNQYAADRDYSLNLYGAQSSNDLARAQFLQDQYNQSYQNQLASNQQDWQRTLDAYGANTAQYNINRQFEADQSQQYYNNLLNTYNLQNQNYNADRQFAYDVYNNQQAQNWDQYQYMNQLRANEAATQYSVLNDAYNRQLASGQAQQQSIAELVNLGLVGNQNMANALNNYYGSMSDLNIERANAAAAAAASKKSGLFGLW